VLFTKEISVRGRQAKVACEDRGRRQPRKDRKAVVEVRATTMTLRPPHRSDRKLSEVTVNVVLVSEVNPPVDDVPVEWLLPTTLPIDTVEQVQTIIQYYTVRWMIEILFRTLKSGCRIEKRRFETKKRMVACLGLYLIVG
jgi:IS4 transposase